MRNSHSSPAERIVPLIAAAVGGACGGWVVGLGEAILVTATSAPEEYGLFAFAIASYGLLGAAVGAGGWAGLSLVALALGRRLPWPPLAVGAVLAFLPLALAIGRYHVLQRIFREGLPLLSGAGLAVHALIAASVAFLAVVFYRKLAPLAARRGASLGILVLWASLFAGAVGVGAMLAPTPPVPEPRAVAADHDARRNVILVVVDTLRADAVAQDASAAATGIGRLAADGVSFSQAHAQASWTRPSMASLFTSLYPTQHGAVHKMDILHDRVTTLAEAFQAAGYRTAGITTNINLAPIFNFQQGFDEYFYLAPSFYFGAADSATRLAIYKGLRVARELLFRHRIHFENYYQDAQVVGAAVESWLAARPPQPFFLYIHYMDPHDPYFEMPYNGRGVARVTDQNPDPRRAAELHALYAQGVDYVQDEMARLIAQFDAHGVYEDSIVAVTSDHGEEFQEHGGWWHGTTLYQEQLLVPLVVKAPGAPRGVTDDRLVQLIDLGPTLLAAAGVAPPAVFAGRDLFSESPAPLVYAEEDHEGNRLFALREGDWKIIVANPDNPRGLRPVELYDLARDPGEQTNLAEALPERVDAMMLALSRFRTLLRHQP